MSDQLPRGVRQWIFLFLYGRAHFHVKKTVVNFNPLLGITKKNVFKKILLGSLSLTGVDFRVSFSLQSEADRQSYKDRHAEVCVSA